MQPRSRQTQFIDAALSCLSCDKKGLGVAPTGAGKTVMMAFIAKAYPRILFLQHSETLLKQNKAAYELVNPGRKTSPFTANRKSIPDGNCAVFGMVLSVANSLDRLPSFDLVVSDEAHRSAGKSWSAVIERLKELNPDIHVLGVTATPERSDRKGLRKNFGSIFDIIGLDELIREGHLVPPRAFVIDIGVQEALRGIKTELAIEALMDQKVVTDRAVKEWAAKAGDRPTVVFASGVKHCEHIAESFQEAGYDFRCIHNKTGKAKVAKTLRDFDAGKFQGLVNANMLTEGWDCQPVSCVMLLTQYSYKSSTIQKVGRGLRKVDPMRYPGVHKVDCLVLDFGRSLLTHGDLIADADIAGVSRTARLKCFKCETTMPVGVLTCPVCGAELPVEAKPRNTIEKGELQEFTMTEFALCELSPFKWERFYPEGDNHLLTASCGFTADAAIILEKGRYHVVAKQKGEKVQYLLETTDKIQALASADDFMRSFGDKTAAMKTKRWIEEFITPKQTKLLNNCKVEHTPFITKYQASCLLFFAFNQKAIKRYVHH